MQVCPISVLKIHLNAVWICEWHMRVWDLRVPLIWCMCNGTLRDVCTDNHNWRGWQIKYDCWIIIETICGNYWEHSGDLTKYRCAQARNVRCVWWPGNLTWPATLVGVPRRHSIPNIRDVSVYRGIAKFRNNIGQLLAADDFSLPQCGMYWKQTNTKSASHRIPR